MRIVSPTQKYIYTILTLSKQIFQNQKDQTGQPILAKFRSIFTKVKSMLTNLSYQIWICLHWNLGYEVKMKFNKFLFKFNILVLREYLIAFGYCPEIDLLSITLISSHWSSASVYLIILFCLFLFLEKH